MTFAVAVDRNAHYLSDSLIARAASYVDAPAKYEAQQQDDYFSRFYRLLSNWRTDTALSSRIEDKVDHPAFQQIVQIGRPVVPLIIKELRHRPDFLFLALRRITDEDPVPPACERPSEMVEAWLSWADRNNVPAG